MTDRAGAASRSVLLVSAGCPGRRATPPVFVRRDEVDLDRVIGPRPGRPGIALIYRCTITGVERRYGIE